MACSLVEVARILIDLNSSVEYLHLMAALASLQLVFDYFQNFQIHVACSTSNAQDIKAGSVLYRMKQLLNHRGHVISHNLDIFEEFAGFVLHGIKALVIIFSRGNERRQHGSTYTFL